MAMSFTFSTCTFRLQIVIKIKFGRIKLEPGNDEETTRTVKLQVRTEKNGHRTSSYTGSSFSEEKSRD